MLIDGVSLCHHAERTRNSRVDCVGLDSIFMLDTFEYCPLRNKYDIQRYFYIQCMIVCMYIFYTPFTI